MRERDMTYGWTGASDGILKQRHFYVQNWRSDVVALLAATSTGSEQVEEIRYDEYGVPFGVPAGDTNADGAVLPDDQAMVASWAAIPLSYDVRGELDLDGDVDEDDLTLVTTEAGTMSGEGEVSTSDIGNRKGYAGYEFDPALSSGYAFYHVRHRVYNANLGTWMQRDPLEYDAGSMNLYEYVNSNPYGTTDPDGLVPHPGTVVAVCCILCLAATAAKYYFHGGSCKGLPFKAWLKCMLGKSFTAYGIIDTAKCINKARKKPGFWKKVTGTLGCLWSNAGDLLLDFTQYTMCPCCIVAFAVVYADKLGPYVTRNIPKLLPKPSPI